MIRALICGVAALSLAASAVPALAQTHTNCINDDPQVGSSGASPAPMKREAPHKKAPKHKAVAKKAPAKPPAKTASAPAPAH